MDKNIPSIFKKMAVLMHLSVFKIVCSFSIRLERMNISSELLVGMPSPLWEGFQEHGALSYKGKWGLKSSPFLSPFPLEGSWVSLTHFGDQQ